MAKNPALRAVSGGSAKAANRGEPFPGGKSARFPPLTIPSASDEAHKVAWQQKTSYRRKFMGTVRATFLIGPGGHIAQVRPKVPLTGHACEPPAGYESLTEATKCR